MDAEDGTLPVLAYCGDIDPGSSRTGASDSLTRGGVLSRHGNCSGGRSHPRCVQAHQSIRQQMENKMGEGMSVCMHVYVCVCVCVCVLVSLVLE